MGHGSSEVRQRVMFSGERVEGTDHVFGLFLVNARANLEEEFFSWRYSCKISDLVYGDPPAAADLLKSAGQHIQPFLLVNACL